MDWGTLIFQLRRNESPRFPRRQRPRVVRALSLDGLRVDAVASMLYLDYSRKEGQWIPTNTAAAKISRRSRF